MTILQKVLTEISESKSSLSGFNNKDTVDNDILVLDEPYSKKIAKYLGCDVNDIAIITEQDGDEIIDPLPQFKSVKSETDSFAGRLRYGILNLNQKIKAVEMQNSSPFGYFVSQKDYELITD